MNFTWWLPARPSRSAEELLKPWVLGGASLQLGSQLADLLRGLNLVHPVERQARECLQESMSSLCTYGHVVVVPAPLALGARLAKERTGGAHPSIHGGDLMFIDSWRKNHVIYFGPFIRVRGNIEFRINICH